MWKIKTYGGCKLVNVQIKSETSKAKWLMEMVTKPQFKINLDIFTNLVGTQKGNIKGRDLIFLQNLTCRTFLKQTTHSTKKL